MNPRFHSRAHLLVLAVSLSCVGIGSVFAQSGANWPSKPIRIVVPMPPGGGGDIVSRGLGEAMVGINVADIPVPHRLAERGW